jgi:hypothetical protein
MAAAVVVAGTLLFGGAWTFSLLKRQAGFQADGLPETTV